MEGNREFASSKSFKPNLNLRKHDFPFVQYLKVGDKGTLDFTGTVIEDAKDDDGDVTKTLKIKGLSPNNTGKMRA